MSDPLPHPALISASDLLDRDDLAAIKFVDGSWFLDASRDPEAEFLAQHIPGAVRFNLDKIADQQSNLPHMLPSPAQFADAVGSMGLSQEDTIVIYETGDLFASPRVWWTFRTFGAQNARLLNGGLPAWRDAGGPVTGGTPDPQRAVEFRPSFDASAVVDLSTMQMHIADGSAQIVDARPAARFRGEAAEPRAGLRSGAMPGSFNLPTADLVQGGRLKSREALIKLCEGVGLSRDAPVITTCGSGVTAALALLALEAAGFNDVRLYDGSWAEWGQSNLDSPVTKA